MDWSKVSIVDGWKVSRTTSGFTLTATFYGKDFEDMPEFGDFVCSDSGSVNCVPDGFESYKIAETSIQPLTLEGPYVCDVTAKAFINTLTGDKSRSLVGTGTYTLGSDVVELSERETLKRLLPEFRKPARADDKGRRIHFLIATATYYVKKTSGLGSYGTFFGIIPHSSFPKFLKDLPGGDNRWRLDEESIEQVTDTDGKTAIYRITRRLRGISNEFKDTSGDRMEWNQSVIGQRDWDDI